MNHSIKFYKKRDFSDILSVTFDFIRAEFKDLIKNVGIIVAPFGILSGILSSLYTSSIQGQMNDMLSSPDGGFDPFAIYNPLYFLSIFGTGILYTIFTGVIYAHIILTLKKGKGNFGPKEVLKFLGSNIFGIIGVGLLSILAAGFGMIFLFIPGIWLSVMFSLSMFAKLNEGISVTDALGRSYSLVKGNWWNTFGIIIVLSIIYMVLGYLIQLPAGIYMGVKTFSSIQEGFFNLDPAYTTIAIFSSIISIIFSAILYIGLAFQYFNLVERAEGVGAAKEIDSIGNDQNEQTSVFSNLEN
ncbi:hypothetical protein [Xanthovirga aplysinae]|uniref:hypothetical protein n=1 Tax=Xanthovirga aplysinae TaxID=2529853 RepID=UPI0012BBD4DF|nr:hypothetical protein [Xanthovirga aplysinae]MTI32847.1 hypothetical protein [Xanthovirga aplysinae]